MKKTYIKLELAILICLFCVPLIGTNVKGGLMPGPPDPPSVATYSALGQLRIDNGRIILELGIVFDVYDGVRLEIGQHWCSEKFFTTYSTLLYIGSDYIYIGNQPIVFNSSWRFEIEYIDGYYFELIFWCTVYTSGDHVFDFNAHGDGNYDLGSINFKIYDHSFGPSFVILYLDLLIGG